MLKNQSVFNFVAIPQVMALATLDLCFMNKNVLHKNVKIRRGQMVQLMTKSRNPRDVAYVFRDYARSIHKKAKPYDPYFIKLSVQLGKIEMWCEHHYPSFISLNKESPGGPAGFDGNGSDARIGIVKRRQDKEKDKILLAQQERLIKAGIDPNRQPEQDNIPLWVLAGMIGIVILVFGLTALLAFGILWYFDLLE